MFQKFTENTIKVIMLAQEEARRIHYPYTGTGQMLLGLIGDMNGEAGKILRSKGVTLQAARPLVETLCLYNLDGLEVMPVELPFTDALMVCLEYISQDVHLVHDVDILQGLMLPEYSIAKDVLIKLGVNIDSLMTEV